MQAVGFPVSGLEMGSFNTSFRKYELATWSLRRNMVPFGAPFLRRPLMFKSIPSLANRPPALFSIRKDRLRLRASDQAP